MRFLVDESLSSRVAELLRHAGRDAVHIRDRGLLGALDVHVMAAARSEDRVLITVDSDFGGLLTFAHESTPSMILVRRAPHRPESQAELLLAALAEVEQHLGAGALIVISPGHARVRPLPVEPAHE